ncbi:cytochrome c [Burkholderia sp. Bp8963]|nr:cytochrome c [Burkholderia sp. Bp8963]
MMIRIATLTHAATALGMALLTLAAGAAPVQAPDAALIARGAYLAKAGDCVACHTAPHGTPFAGGQKMVTPMGAIYTTNITPDPDTGIGRYTEADFARALREGVAKDGHNLYPAMPYPSYAKVKDDDMKALYAYFMHGVEPVKQPNRAADIPWPLGMRWPLKLWNAVFLDTKVYADKPGKDAMWNRGAYLVQGLGHCGSCHTPRGVGFQEKALDEGGAAYLSGAPIDNWFASNLTSEPNAGLGRWSQADIALFIKTGANRHASAFGSMTDVINRSTQWLATDDVNAIARYLKSLPVAGGSGMPPYHDDPGGVQPTLAGSANDSGSKLYATYCMHCHGSNGKAFAPLLAPLAGNPAVLEPNPTSTINVTLNGAQALVIDGLPAAYPMPKFSNVLTDQQVADVLTFVRSHWNNASTAVSTSDVAKLRKATAVRN